MDVNVYFKFNKLRTSAYLLYKVDTNIFMCKICLQDDIKLSTCMPVELCMKCAPTPKDCITLLDTKDRISNIACTKHIKEACTGCEVNISQKLKSFLIIRY